MTELSIKTSLFYLFGEQVEQAKESINELFESETILKTVPEALTYAVANKVSIKFDSNCDTLPVKHKKTFLLYFSEEEHKSVNNYINSFLPKECDAVLKKQLRTKIVIKLLSEVNELQN